MVKGTLEEGFPRIAFTVSAISPQTMICTTLLHPRRRTSRLPRKRSPEKETNNQAARRSNTSSESRREHGDERPFDTRTGRLPPLHPLRQHRVFRLLGRSPQGGLSALKETGPG